MKNVLLYQFIFSVFLTLIVYSCGEDSLHETLDRIDRLSENSPRDASLELKKIDSESLSDAERHYYDLLSIKISYKNFEKQTSDSIIRRVIDYYAESNDKRKYAEALYYGGAVNESIGDYPGAIKYYNESLELLPASTNYKKLRGNVLAGLSWIYNSLRLYDEAIEVINLSIDNDIAIKDTTGLLYDLEFSGALHFHKGIYKTADSLFVKTIELAGGKNDIITARQMMYRAAIRYKNNEIDSAVCMIRTVPERVTDAYHSLALAYACDIYLKAGLLDSALFYALELKNLHDEYNAKAAYRTLLSPEIAKSLNQDSVLKYAGEYGTVLENFMDRNGDRAALIQSSLFNYEKQLREKEKALKAKQTRNYIIIAIAVALTAALIFILFLKNKNRNNELRLLKAENSLRKLKDSIEHLKQNSSYLYNDKICPENAEKSSTVNEKDISRRIENPEIDEARIRLREEILSTLKDVRHVGSVNPVILNSDIYAKLKELLSIKKPMSTYKDAESELYRLFHVSFKDFQFSLNLLTDNQMTPVDWETAMLIKCGFSATEISILSAKSSGAISSRRASLSLKIFGTKIGNVKLDNAIRLL